MKKILCFMCIGCWAFTARTQSTNGIPTNNIPTVSIVTTNKYAETSIFNQKLEINTRVASFDRFGPQTSIRWMRIYDRFGYESIDRINLSGRDLMKQTIVSSSRDAFASWTAPNAYDWANNLWIGSIGNTPEERIKPGSVTPTASERTLWQSIKTDGNVSYGWRPYDSYVYATARFGHWLNNPALILHSRLYYGPFRTTRSDFNAVVPMPLFDGEISGGISFNPADIINNPADKTVYIRYSRGLLGPPDQTSKPGLKGLINSASFFTGYSSTKNDSRIEVGFNSHWPEFRH